MAKATAIAPANIAFVKYWGAKDLERAIPLHPSISMTLDRCCSHSTVAFDEGSVDDAAKGAGQDSITLVDEAGAPAPTPPGFDRRIRRHLDLLRQWAGKEGSFRVATRNSFPAAAGMASSASGFSALTLAATKAMGIDLSEKESSILARRSGSGSAARSVLGGYVEWPAPGQAVDDESCHAVSLAPASHWPLADVVALVETGPKEVSSLDGHRRAGTSPHFAARLELVPGRLAQVREAIQEKDVEKLGVVLEEDAIELHLVAMSSRPPIFYWKPASLTVLEAVRRWREEGIHAYSTMDAGANVHVICPLEESPAVAERLAALPGVDGVIEDRVGDGPRFVGEDLF